MNDFDMYIAKTQSRLAFFLIIILVFLTALLLSIMIFPSMKPQSEIINLLVQVVTGVLALCGSAIAYFFARHRPATKADEDSPGDTSPVSKTVVKEVNTSSTTVSSLPSPNTQEKTI